MKDMVAISHTVYDYAGYYYLVINQTCWIVMQNITAFIKTELREPKIHYLLISVFHLKLVKITLLG